MRCRKNEKIVVDKTNFENSRAWPKSLMEKMEEMPLKIEEHHVIYSEDITNVEWCPKFVKPEIHGHVRGGKDLRHHRCRDCGRLCLHLLGRPGSKKQCLKWEKGNGMGNIFQCGITTKAVNIAGKSELQVTGKSCQTSL